MNIGSTLRNWFGLSDERPAPGPLDDYWYSDATFGVSGQSTWQSTAVYSCIRVISETIGSLPCMMFEKTPAGKVLAKDHPLYSVIHDQANATQTANEYWETVASHVMATGNSYSRVLYDSRNNASELIPIEPQYVRVMRDEQTGVKAYEVIENTQRRIYFDGQILHIPGLSYDGLIGYNPIEAARKAIEMQLGAERYAERVFRNHAIPPAYVSIPGNADPSAIKSMGAWWQQTYGGQNQGKIGILSGGGEIKTVSVNHRDLQFLELRKFQLEEIARIYRVPLHLIQSLDRSTNNNIEHQSLDFVTHTIRPWAVRLEKRINMILLGPQERQRYFAEFNLDALMRGDAASRSAYYASGIQNGWLKPDEARQKENLNPQGGAADRLYIQGATVPLDSSGEQPNP
jgi:HK97 family phage portal protein